MKRLTRNTAYSLLYIATLLIVSLLCSCGNNYDTDLEIYTTEDIYYINGLTLTSESDEVDTTFRDNEELKIFLSDLTSVDANACQELVYHLDVEIGDIK